MKTYVTRINRTAAPNTAASLPETRNPSKETLTSVDSRHALIRSSTMILSRQSTGWAARVAASLLYDIYIFQRAVRIASDARHAKNTATRDRVCADSMGLNDSGSRDGGMALLIVVSVASKFIPIANRDGSIRQPNVLTLSCKSRLTCEPRKAARRLPRPTRSGRSELAADVPRACSSSRPRRLGRRADGPAAFVSL